MGAGLYLELRAQTQMTASEQKAQKCGQWKSSLPYINFKLTEDCLVLPLTMSWLILVGFNLKSKSLIACFGLQVYLVPSSTDSYQLVSSRVTSWSLQRTLNSGLPRSSSILLVSISPLIGQRHFRSTQLEAFAPVFLSLSYSCLSTFSVSLSCLSFNHITGVLMHFCSFSIRKERKLHEVIVHISLVLAFILRTKRAMLGIERWSQKGKAKKKEGTKGSWS